MSDLPGGPHEPDVAPGPEAGRPRRNPVALGARVLAVQALTLLALWLLQAAFGG